MKAAAIAMYKQTLFISCTSVGKWNQCFDKRVLLLIAAQPIAIYRVTQNKNPLCGYGHCTALCTAHCTAPCTLHTVHCTLCLLYLLFRLIRKAKSKNSKKSKKIALGIFLVSSRALSGRSKHYKNSVLGDPGITKIVFWAIQALQK